MRLVNNVNIIAGGVMGAHLGEAMPLSIVPSFGTMTVAVSGLSGYRTVPGSVKPFGYAAKCADTAVDESGLDMHQRSQRWSQPHQDWQGFEAGHKEQLNSEQKADVVGFFGLKNPRRSSHNVMRSGSPEPQTREGRVEADVMRQ